MPVNMSLLRSWISCRCRVRLSRAESSRVRGAHRSSDVGQQDRPTFRWSAERPAIRPTRPARAGWAALRRFRFRDIPLWGDRRVPPLYPLPRAHEGRAGMSAVDSATCWGRLGGAAAAGRRRSFVLVLHRALPDLQRMKHKPDQALGHLEVFLFLPSEMRNPPKRPVPIENLIRLASSRESGDVGFR